MERHRVIQSILDLYINPKYLEIGVEQGVTFHKLRAAMKYAVDPQFNFDANNAAKVNSNSRYFEVSSDKFFVELNWDVKFDVIFLDGLHTFDQTLRDLMNAAAHLANGGVIVIDDVMPVSFASSIGSLTDLYAYRRAIPSTDSTWMGDVYKLVFFIANAMPSFSYASVQENRNQTLLWRKKREVPFGVQLKIETIASMSYMDLVTKDEHFLFKPLVDIIESIAAEL